MQLAPAGQLSATPLRAYAAAAAASRTLASAIVLRAYAAVAAHLFSILRVGGNSVTYDTAAAYTAQLSAAGVSALTRRQAIGASAATVCGSAASTSAQSSASATCGIQPSPAGSFSVSGSAACECNYELKTGHY